MIEYRNTSEFNRGILFDLLIRSYGEWLLEHPMHENDLKREWQTFDSEAFDHSDTIGTCVRITCKNGNPIGLFSWDPRKLPEEGIIGQNCIIPEERNKGYGRKQIKEMVRLFKRKGTRIISVTTAGERFFLPARKMYLACGFKEVKRIGRTMKDPFELVRYEMRVG